MSVSGLCEVCSSAEVTGTCNRCGQLACRRHYDGDSGWCVECLADAGERPATGSNRENRPDGVDTYEF